MDIDLLRTFLEVRRTQHFGNAAKALFVTQAAVSARIKKLEEILNIQLFTRDGRSIRMSPDGHRFVRHAELMLSNWRSALQEVSANSLADIQISVGALNNLWSARLQFWLEALHDNEAQLAIIAETSDEETLHRKVLDGYLDIAFVYEPPALEELMVEEVGETYHELYSTQQGVSVEDAMSVGYVRVDWSYSFSLMHNRLFPDAGVAQYRMSNGQMARDFILRNGGAAYLTRLATNLYVKSGQLFKVADAQMIARPIYMIYHSRSDRIKLYRHLLSYLPKQGK